MKIKTLIEQLQKLEQEFGNVTVMMEEPNKGKIYSTDGALFYESKDNEFPKSWNMSKGFKFVLIHS